ncbi:hypothetical protein B0H67DRAFT_640979 [Lasiosphaeris hirsuta]|uniref:Uncharacterized protein n=1 Tax=Lasiosphaeris hirsuta TaxID=260670 RepID=A0AA40AYR3_9PEZI|nr:hypothetical protein B0H67DRAFT_640979 [Lasiosphaeris hirsuta]
MSLATTTLPLLPSIATATQLITTWSPPSACSTPVPRFLQGTCVGNTCTSDNFPDVDLWTAWVNWPYETALGSTTAAACVPPGWNEVLRFAFDPATGCPSGYVTAATRSYPYASDMAIVSCCPSAFSTMSYDPSIRQDENGNSVTLGDCIATRTYSTDKPYLGVASGYHTQQVLVVTNGVTLTTTAEYYTESVIRTSSVTASAITVEVHHPVVKVLVPSSSSSPPQGGFTIFQLSAAYSIVILVVVILVIIALLCCTCCCLIHRHRRRLKASSNHPYITSPPAYHPSFFTSQGAYGNGQPTCPHGTAHVCAYKQPCETSCCACRDARPAGAALPVEIRTSTYCFPCYSRWRLSPDDIPPEWQAEFHGVADAGPESHGADEDVRCGHGIVAAGCLRRALKAKQITCCACLDGRRGLYTRDARVFTYCATCAEFWRRRSPAEAPPEWGRVPDVVVSPPAGLAPRNPYGRAKGEAVTEEIQMVSRGDGYYPDEKEIRRTKSGRFEMAADMKFPMPPPPPRLGDKKG